MKTSIFLFHQLGSRAVRAALAACLAVGLTLPATADLTHRYSFTSDASDSVGGANGTIQGGVTISSGVASFPATVASGPGSDYIELPPGLISNYTAVTFEFWISPGVNGIWPELYAFGNQDAGGAGANMVMFCPHSGPGDYRMSYAQADPGYTDEHVSTGPGVLDNLGPLSVACVYDPANNTMSLYTNGVRVSTLSPVTSGAKVFSLTNVYNVHSWLGRSLYNGDGAYNGTLDEFRIYNAPLGGLQVAVDNSVGPDALPTNIVINSFSLNVNTNMLVGEREDSSVTYSVETYGAFTVPGSTEASYSSADTNIIVVTPTGRLFAMAAGSTTISAAATGKTNSAVVFVSATPKLLHRYSFTTDASDSVGGANGTLQGGATITGGAVVLSGMGSSGSPGDYVDLPNNLFTNLTSVSIETWVTDNGTATWGRVWDFGNSAGGEDTSTGGGDNLFLTNPSGGATLRGVINNGGGEQQVNTDPLTTGKKTHVVWINDAAHHVSYLYVDGALKNQNNNTTLAPADLGPTLNDWLGRSQYNDPMYNGAIDEFRIWEGQLSAFQVALNAASGPDQLGPTNPGPVIALHLTINTNMTKGGFQNAAVAADFASVSNVNALSLGITFQSSDTNVATVDTNGIISGVGIGTTTITGSYGGKTDSEQLSVIVKPTILAHRWSFSETTGTTVSDSIGTATGNLSASGATLGSGAVTLDGIAGYVDLPGHLIDNYDSVTFETWVTVNSATLNDSSARLFVFGASDGLNEVGVTGRSGGQNTLTRYFGPVNLTVIRNGHLAIDKEFHLVTVFNPPQGTIDVFLNGAWQNSITNLSFTLGAITNLASRLGANLGGTNFTAAAISEFRIYNGILDLFGIRVSDAAGPDNLVTNPGAPSSIKLTVDPMMIQGSKQVPHTHGNFTAVTNVDLSQTAQINYSSSDATVVAVTSDGLLQAMGSGVATITAGLGGKSDSKTITVVPKQTALVHRYSFTNDASDSVGAQDGSLWGNAQIQSGAVVLDGDPNQKDSYVALPSRLISSYDAVTLESWVNLSSTLGTWCRIFDFGSENAGGNGTTYIFLAPHTGTPSTRVVLSDGAEAQLDLGANSQLDGYIGQIAVVYDPPHDQQLIYTNGVLAQSAPLNGKLLSGVNDLNCWIGRSLYSADSGLSASIDEFRIYAGALTAAQIAADNTAGPDKVVLSAPITGGPELQVSTSGNNLIISWPVSATGFTLQTTLTLGASASWSTVTTPPVVVNGFNTVTVPMTGQASFYRLFQ
jgi:hypothetical protein